MGAVRRLGPTKPFAHALKQPELLEQERKDGGDVAVRAARPRGSVFSVTLPLRAA